MEIDVVSPTRAGTLRRVRVIDRELTQRSAYQIVIYKHCVFRVRWPSGRIVVGDRPYIELSRPVRCRGEVWERASGKAKRAACDDALREYKFARRDDRVHDMVIHEAEARLLGCKWVRLPEAARRSGLGLRRTKRTP